jgi:hypothetical protein
MTREGACNSVTAPAGTVGRLSFYTGDMPLPIPAEVNRPLCCHHQPGYVIDLLTVARAMKPLCAKRRRYGPATW